MFFVVVSFSNERTIGEEYILYCFTQIELFFKMVLCTLLYIIPVLHLILHFVISKEPGMHTQENLGPLFLFHLFCVLGYLFTCFILYFS